MNRHQLIGRLLLGGIALSADAVFADEELFLPNCLW